MTPERWQRIEELFQAARKRATAGERAAFLDGACSDDADLRAQVEKLLKAEDSAGSFINTSAVKVAAGMIAADRAAEMQGRTIAHYQIISALGAGGMGEVYLATDTRNGRQVALKLLPDHLLKDSDRVRRFQQEARAVLSLNHPNIVTVYEIGQEDGTQYIASELVKGQTLRSRLAGTPLKLHEALDIAAQVAAALAEAHHEGVVHRDIKPENIMLRPDGYVKVLDFGIAKLTETPSATQTEAPTLMKIQTRPGMVLGSAHYMSPEQGRGLPVDERTDIWSLGVVLYEMIAGRVPFDGETPSDCLAAILDKEPAALARFAADVPEALEVIVASALMKDRDERYHSAKEFLGALRRLKQRLDASAELERSVAPHADAATSSQSRAAIAGGASQTVPVTQPNIHSTSSAEYIVSEIKRHKTGITVALILVVVAAGAGAFALYRILTSATNKPPHLAKFSSLTTGGKVGDLAVEGELSMSPDGRYVAYVAHKISGGTTQSSVWVLQVATNTQAQVVAPSTADYVATAFSPDGQFIYFNNRETRLAPLILYRVPVIGGTPTKVLDDVTSAVSFSPDGKRFVFVRDENNTGQVSDLIEASTDGSTDPKIIATRKSPQYFAVEGPSWSPDGKLIACAAGNLTGKGQMTVVGVPADGGPEVSLTKESWVKVYRVIWLGDGGGLVLTAGEQLDSGIQIFELSYPGGVSRKVTNDLNNYGAGSLGVAADSSSIVTVQTRMDVQLWVTGANEDESRAKQITHGTWDGIGGLNWTRQGRIIYPTSATGDQVDLWSVNPDGSQAKQITRDSYVDTHPAMSPDGRYIVFRSARGGRKLWRIDADGSNPKQLTDGTSVDDRPAFSTDSQWVFFNTNPSSALELWKVSINGGAPGKVSDIDAAWPDVSPDGKSIVCFHVDEQNHSPLQLIIFSSEGGQPTKTINLPLTTGPFQGGPKWLSDGRSIAFVNRVNNIPNVWSQPIDGSPPKPLTNFKSLWIYDYTPSPDGHQLALARGDQYQDIVLIKDFR